MLIPSLSSRALFMHLIWYSTSLIPLSIIPLLPEDLTGECSNMVCPSPLLSAIFSATARMGDSWSVLMMILLFTCPSSFKNAIALFTTYS